MPDAVDNSIEYNPKSVQLYNSIREYAAAGYSKREIAKILHCGRNTVTKYLNGDYESLCKRDYSEYSCAVKSHFRKSGNQMSGKWKSSYARLLA